MEEGSSNIPGGSGTAGDRQHGIERANQECAHQTCTSKDRSGKFMQESFVGL